MTHDETLANARVLVDGSTLQGIVTDLGARIAQEYAGEDLRLITILKGGLFFLADLCRAIPHPLSLDFLAVLPYAPNAGGVVRLTKDLSDDIEGASVILVEDVVDTGLTANYVLSLLRARHPKRLEVCTLLDKPARRIANIPLAYTGLQMPDAFLVGYGLDLDGRYRNLPYVAALPDETVL